LLNTAWSLSAMDIESSVSAAAFIHCSIHSLSLFPSFACRLCTVYVPPFSPCFRLVGPRNTSHATWACRGRRGSTVPEHCSCWERFEHRIAPLDSSRPYSVCADFHGGWSRSLQLHV
jgi:hypothetical protein